MAKKANLKMRWVILVVLLVVAIAAPSVFATGSYDGGDGLTPATAFQINTAAQMDEIGQHSEDWGSYFILTADIDLGATGTAFNIIGSSGAPFTGSFDGDGHTINNFIYTSTGTNYIGLFGWVGSGGEIKDLDLTNVNVNAGTDSVVGGLVGANVYGTISNCYATGLVTGGDFVGGLVGENVYGTVSNCQATGFVTGTGNFYVGGLVGYNINGTVSNCYARGTVTGTNHVGGLVGRNDYTVSNCYSYSNVTGDYYVGGLVGRNEFSTVSNCYATGSVSGTNYVGGLVGRNYLASFSNCYATSSVTGSEQVGGLVGWNYDSDIFASFWDTQTTGQGSGVGYNTGSGTVEVYGRTTAQMQTESTFTDYGWDFIGETANGTEDIWIMFGDGLDYPRLTWTFEPPSYPGSGTEGDPYQISTPEQMNEIGRWPFDWDKDFILMADIDLAGYTGTAFNIIGSMGSRFFGSFDGDGHIIRNFTYSSTGTDHIGLFGYVGNGGEIKNLGMTNVNVDAGSGNYVAALVGWNSVGTVSNCYATGSVSGNQLVGGLVGNGYYGTILNCYTAETVIGVYMVGGLMGHNSEGTVLNSYAIGNVTGTGNLIVGGLMGRNSGTVSNCYATASVTGNQRVGGLVGDSQGWGTVSNCYAAGYVSATGVTGGLVGYHMNGSYTSCFWDKTVNAHLIGAGDGVGNMWKADEVEVIGETTENMQIETTYTDGGWDFVNEIDNGIEDIWRLCVDGVDYPLLWWQFNKADFVCPDGVDFIDFSVLGLAWQSEDGHPKWNHRCDISDPIDNIIDELDLDVFCDNWLFGK